MRPPAPAIAARSARRTPRRGASSRTRRPARDPAAHERPPQRRRRRATRRSAARSAAGVAGRHEHGLAVAAGDVAVAGEVGRDDRRPRRHRLEQHDAERLALDRREARDRRAAEAPRLLGLGDPPEPLDAGDAARRASASVSGPSPATQSSASRSSTANASSSTPRPLRGSWRPTNRMPAAVAGHGSALGERLDVDAVRQDLARHRRTSPRRCAAPPRRPRCAPRGARPSSRSGRRNASYHALRPGHDGVERADRGDVGAEERGVVRARRQRLVEVHDVGSERAQRLERAARRRPCPTVIGAIEPFDGKPRVGPRLVIPASGGGPSDGARTRASTPTPRSARASPSTWTCTPPSTDSEYGQIERDPQRVAASASPSCPVIPVGRRVGRPVRLHHEPLLGRGADELLEAVRELLGHALRHRRAAGRGARPASGAPMRTQWPRVAPEVGRRREQRRARCATRASPGRRARGRLAEELDLDAVAGEVAVAHQAHDPARVAARAAPPRPASGPERDDLHADRPGGPRRTTRRARAARPARPRPSRATTAPGEPRARDVPVPEVRERQDRRPGPPATAASRCSQPSRRRSVGCELGAAAAARAGTARASTARSSSNTARGRALERGRPSSAPPRDAPEVALDLTPARRATRAPCARDAMRASGTTERRREAPRRLSAGPVREIGGAGAGHGGSARRARRSATGGRSRRRGRGLAPDHHEPVDGGDRGEHEHHPQHGHEDVEREPDAEQHHPLERAPSAHRGRREPSDSALARSYETSIDSATTASASTGEVRRPRRRGARRRRRGCTASATRSHTESKNAPRAPAVPLWRATEPSRRSGSPLRTSADDGQQRGCRSRSGPRCRPRRRDRRRSARRPRPRAGAAPGRRARGPRSALARQRPSSILVRSFAGVRAPASVTAGAHAKLRGYQVAAGSRPTARARRAQPPERRQDRGAVRVRRIRPAGSSCRPGGYGVKTFPTAKIRNVALVGHGGAGKTTLAEALLFVAGAIPRMGRVEDGNTVCDFDPEEQKRRISVSLALAPVRARGPQGQRDRHAGLRRLRRRRRRRAPRRRPRGLRRVGGRGRRGADRGRVAARRGRAASPARSSSTSSTASARRSQRTLDELKDEVRRRRRAARAPDRRGGRVPRRRRPPHRRRGHLRRRATGGASTGPVPDDMATEEHSVHDALVEGIVVADDDLMERYLADEKIVRRRARARARQGHRRGAACSRCCAAARRSSIGVDRLAHFIVEEGPAPDGRATGRRPRSCSRRSSTPTSGA